MKKNELIAYTGSFVSFVLDRLKYEIKEIILFGSVARGDFTNESDIDLFFDVLSGKKIKLIENDLKLIESKFYKSKVHALWKQKGINNGLNFKVGILDQWDLKNSVLSDGLVLYGKYKSLVKGEGLALISFDPIKNITKRNKIIRALFGRKETGYFQEGLVNKLKGKQISPTVFYVNLQFADQILKILKKEKISYQIKELWGK